jgi:hypothetical protein
MSRTVIGLVLLIGLPALSGAQSFEERSRNFYLFGAPGVFISEGAATMEFGGGAEWFVSRVFAMGVDGSVMIYPECLDCGGYLLGSVNGSYYPLRGNKLSPFVTAGIGGAGGEASVTLFNFGGGFNYWAREGLGFRIEIRDHVDTEFAVHNISLRIGVTF